MYLIKNKYFEILRNCFQESVDHMKKIYEQKRDIEYEKWAIDQNWKKLQKIDNWLTLDNNLGIQRKNYSDIENKNVDYTNYLK